MRHAGIGWPENAGGEHPNVETILSMPGIRSGCTLICSPSARYWYRQVRAACPLVVWRSIPRQGKLPAQLGWDRKRVADECLNLWDEQPHGNGTEWFLPLNELNFLKENGGPFPGYQQMAQNLAALRIELRSRLPGNVKLMWPAWVPSDDGAYLDQWRQEAEQYDAICLHAYGDVGAMWERYQAYRDAFPGMPIFVGEWNANHTGADERAGLSLWADIAAAEPLFMGAAYYIWETHNDGEQDLSIWGNDDRLALFRDPPAIPDQEPVPMPDLPRGIDLASYQGYPDWPAVAASGISFAITKATEGVGYVNPTFAHNWNGAKANGIIRGAYHFARPSVNGAIAEAEFFANHVEAAGIEAGDLVALDLEDTNAGGDLGPWVLDWLRHVEQRLGVRGLIYTGSWYSEPHGLANYPEIGSYGLWLAAYQSHMPTPPAPWGLIAIWQNTDALSVPGIAGPVDGDIYNGELATLMLYGKPADAPAPPAPSYSVGSGILERMAAFGDSPSTDEVYQGAGGQFSEAFGRSGRRYVWVPSTGAVYVFEPAA